jgi:hypothetical protein
MISLIVIGHWAFLHGTSSAQPQRISNADPCFDYEVAGTVMQSDGKPATNIVVHRVQSAKDHSLYRTDAGAHFHPVTNAKGEFRIAARGLGFGEANDWTLLVSRSNCVDSITAVTLREGKGCGRREALGIVIRLPACTAK